MELKTYLYEEKDIGDNNNEYDDAHIAGIIGVKDNDIEIIEIVPTFSKITKKSNKRRNRNINSFKRINPYMY